MKKKLKINFKVIAILLGGLSILLRYLFSLDPNVTERIYSKGIFLGIRFVLDYSVGLLPFPFFYLIIVILVFFIGKTIVQWIRTKKDKKEKEISWKNRILKVLLSIGAFIGIIVFFFYFFWGFNYERLPIEVHLKLKPEPLDINGIRSEAKLAFQMAVDARENIPFADNNALDTRFLPEGFDNKIRVLLEKVLKAMGYPVPGRIRGRRLWPGGLLMSFAVGGFYLPFTGEAYVPANLTAMEIPFSMAHEMAHGYGFPEEGTANFLAYLACISSKDPLIKYSGCLQYFSYISNDLYRASIEEYKELIKKLPPGIISDSVRINMNWKQYRGWFMDLGRKINDAYLKSQGIREGVKSYNRFVVLAAAWRKNK